MTTSFTPSNVPITIDVTNPCKSTTLQSITFDTTPLSVWDGQTDTSTFTEPTDGVDTSTGFF